MAVMLRDKLGAHASSALLSDVISLADAARRGERLPATCYHSLSGHHALFDVRLAIGIPMGAYGLPWIPFLRNLL